MHKFMPVRSFQKNNFLCQKDYHLFKSSSDNYKLKFITSKSTVAKIYYNDLRQSAIFSSITDLVLYTRKNEYENIKYEADRDEIVASTNSQIIKDIRLLSPGDIIYTYDEQKHTRSKYFMLGPLFKGTIDDGSKRDKLDISYFIVNMIDNEKNLFDSNIKYLDVSPTIAYKYSHSPGFEIDTGRNYWKDGPTPVLILNQLCFS